MPTNNDWTKQSGSRADADRNRESFHVLHERQIELNAYVKDHGDWIPAGVLSIDSQTRLRFYTIITGDIKGGIWLNMARQKARHAYLLGKRVWHHEFMIGVVWVAIDLNGRAVYVRITAGGVRYEFFTSEHIDGTYSSPGWPFDVAGQAMRSSFPASGQRTKPLYSTELTPPAAEWAVRLPSQLSDPTTKLITWPGWRKQKFQERIWFGRSGEFVTSTQSQPGGLITKCGWRSPYLIQPYAYLPGGLDVDYGEDISPAYYGPGSLVPIVAAPTMESDWLWWRAAAVQRQSGRRFFICADNYGRMHVYPVKSRSPLFRVPPGEFKTYTPPYPAWVTVPDITDNAQFDRDWLWRFNSDATQCVSIPFHSEVAQDAFKYNVPPNTVSPPSSVPRTPMATLFAVAADRLGGPDPGNTTSVDPANITPALNDTPGLVEFRIDITVTGPGEMDFEVVFVLLRSTYFDDDQRYIFDAAYALKDVEKTGVVRDTLITAEVECKVPTGYYWPIIYVQDEPGYGFRFVVTPPIDPWPYEIAKIDGVVSMRSWCVVNTNDTSMVRTEKVRFPIWGPGYFSYGVGGWAAVGVGDTPDADTYFVSISNSSLVPWSGLPNPLRRWPHGPSAFSGPPPFGLGPGAPTKAREDGHLLAMELSTLSLVYVINDHTEGTQATIGISYGEEFYRRDGTVPVYPPTGFQNPPYLVDTPEVVMGVQPYFTCLRLLQHQNYGAEFCVHPSGNWSLYPNKVFGLGSLGSFADYDALDWISAVTGTDADTGRPTRTRYRHRDIYNDTFGVSPDYAFRDYSFYTIAGFPGKVIVDHGGFRIAGFWIGNT